MKQKNNAIRMFVPFMSLDISESLEPVLRSGWIGEGPKVHEFETKLSRIVGVPHVVTVNSGTSALHLALVLAGVQRGDEVITTAQTMLATSSSILQQGAKPVFADIQYETGNLSPTSIEKKVTKKTKAILVVHWGGYPCDMNEIHRIAKKHNLIVIEDAAHALGATYHNKPIGSLSPLTTFSFQAIKLITTGDGGAIAIKSSRTFNQARRLKWFGIDRDKRKASELGEPLFNVSELGYKYHMNDINATIGLCNLTHLRNLLRQRRKNAKRLNSALNKIQGITPHLQAPDRQSAYWLYLVHVEKRLNFIRMMKDRGIETSVVHSRIDSNSIFGGLTQELEQLESYNKTHLALPIHNSLTDEDVSYMIDTIRSGW